MRHIAVKLIQRHTPIIIGVTGSVGKTTAREAIYGVLSHKFTAVRNDENYNNEFGVPLTVMGVKPLDGPKSILKKIIFLWSAFKALLRAYGILGGTFPKMLVLELGADRPGDISYLVNVVKPQIGVITAVGEVPVHVEYYASPEAVIMEKSELIRCLPVNGLAVLNYDDQTVLDMKKYAKCPVSTFGFYDGADVRVSEVSFFANDARSDIGGLSFKIHQGENFIPVRIHNFLGTHQLYGVLTAVVVGAHLGLNLVEISEALDLIEFPKGRMKLLKGIKETTLIDDTYNASPIATIAALDVLNEYGNSARRLGKKKVRKIAVLGDMKELGKYETEAHRLIGVRAGECADIVIAVGQAARFTAEAAESILGPAKVFYYHDTEEAKIKIQNLMKEGDIILVKGSQSMRMEKIVKEIMGEPELAKELLTRQTGKWASTA
ncbi:MAG: UDP-N-acetylmuramoyl-tripeptide--D-alanyl-D-alanine ligase [Parcubacteria group bacterium Licking1014_17]|nr:MAG: UDP-N-acetylmuramoyl-tripeptide--D-alanyl-D-alanine ligase [Parcubacteria group bacterium Licking1014_17]